jgi:hypothetical protein
MRALLASAATATNRHPRARSSWPRSGRISIGLFASHSNVESAADLTHPLITESAEAFYKRSDRYALNRIEIDDGPPWDRIVTRLEQNLARYSTDRGCARPDQSASKSWNRCISAEHYDRATSDLWNLTPPDLSPGRACVHEAPAAFRNASRSPHSSAESSGDLSYPS